MKMTKTRWVLLIAFGLFLGFFGACAHPRHVAVVADAALFEVLNDAHAQEQLALCGQPSCRGIATAPTVVGWTDVKSQTFNQKLLPAVEAGRQFNAALAAWKPGAPMPEQIKTTITSIGDALAAVTADFPDGTKKTRILADIGKAQQLILNAVSTFLAVKGS